MLVYCTFFSLRPGFVSLGFTGKVFNEVVLTYKEQSRTSYEYCTLFPSLGFIPLGFTSKVLIRYILYGSHSRGCCKRNIHMNAFTKHLYESSYMWNE